MRKTRIGFACLLALVTIKARSQDIHFAQVYETPLFLSPANTGFYNGYIRAIANYRNQWPAMNGAFQTIAVSIDGGLFRSKKRPAFMGLGLTIYDDRAGVAKMGKTVAMLNASGLVKLGKKSALSVGLAGGTNATNGNYAALTYESQFNGNTLDANLVSGEIPYRQFTTVDLAAGVAYEFTQMRRDPDHDDVVSFRVAFGAFHINQPVQEYGAGSSYRLPVRYSAAVTSLIDLTDTKFTITPAVVYQNDGPNNLFLVGSYLKYRVTTGTKVTGEKTQNAFGFGLFYRNRDAIIPKLIFDIGDFSAGVAYEANVSGYRTATNGFGGFEISLRYNNLASSLFETRKEYR
jgi:type IX secretion system PorP/SprF family membrane protein